jgi:hypothetical protein
VTETLKVTYGVEVEVNNCDFSTTVYEKRMDNLSDRSVADENTPVRIDGQRPAFCTLNVLNIYG